MRYVLLVALVTCVDQTAKYLVVRSMTLYESLQIVPGFFNLTFITNRGAAFSLLADIDSPWRHYFFVFIGVAAVIALSVLWFQMDDTAKMQRHGISLISGGACGNLIDRLISGEVVDFLDFYYRSYHWPAFNIADVAICTGVIIVLVWSFLEQK